MRLRVLFVKYEDDLMPNALVVTDDYMEDEHGGIPDFFTEECEKVRNLSPDAEYVEAFVSFPDSVVERLFKPPTIVANEVKRAEEAS